MDSHPADHALMRFVHGQLPESESATLAEHLRTCRACGEQVACLRQVDSLLRGAASEHPDASELVAYASETNLTGEERARIERHMLLCPGCREELGLLDACAALAHEPWDRVEEPPAWLHEVVSTALPEAHERAPGAAGRRARPSPAELWGRPAEARQEAVLRRHGQRWYVLAAAVACVLLCAAVAVAVKVHLFAPPLERAWVLPTVDPNVRVVEGVGGKTGDATFRWGMRGLNAAATLVCPGGRRTSHLLALGFVDSPEHPEGLIQLYNPSASRTPAEALLMDVPLVPSAMAPYELPYDRWRVNRFWTIPCPGEGRDDLLVEGYDVGWFPTVLVRYRCAEGRELQRLGTFFHSGAVGFELVQIDGRSMALLWGRGNVHKPPGMPGKYLQVAGLVDLSKLSTPSLWQNPLGRGKVNGDPLPTGAAATYVFFAPIPGFDRCPDISGTVVAARTGGPYVILNASYRQYRLDASRRPEFLLIMDDASQRYGEVMDGLMSQFMGGFQRQVVSIPQFETSAEGYRWMDDWYRRTYRPEVEKWAELVEAQIRRGTLAGEFVDQFRRDMLAIRESG